MKKQATMFLAVLTAVMLFAVPVMAMDIGGADVSAYAKFGYPVDSNMDNGLNVHVAPDYMLKSGVTADMGKVSVYGQFDNVENVSLDYTIGTDYMFTDNVGMFAEHVSHDMQDGRSDYALTWAGVSLKIK